jgi:hypothetical protein
MGTATGVVDDGNGGAKVKGHIGRRRHKSRNQVQKFLCGLPCYRKKKSLFPLCRHTN